MGVERLPNGSLSTEDEVEDEEGGGKVIGSCVLVPKGTYELRYNYYRTNYFIDQAKVTVYFSIVAPETYAGLPIERFYNVDVLKGPPKKYGRFDVSARRTLVREVTALVGEPKRTDRISFSALRGKRIMGELETVTKNYQKRSLPPSEHYSRVVRLVGLLPNEDW